MRLALVVEVDDAQLAAYIGEVYADAPPETPRPEPAAFLAERLQGIAEDELPVALWGWPEKVGLTVTVEEAPQ